MPAGLRGHAFDATRALGARCRRPTQKAKPGTPQFRAALRDALETSKNVAGVHGVFMFTQDDHYGLDDRGRVMVKVVNGDWELVK